MWPQRIAPYVGESDSDIEPFADWYVRIHTLIPNVPEDVADQWIHRHWRQSPYEYLPLEQLTFEEESWTVHEIDRVRFGTGCGPGPGSSDRLDDQMTRGIPLAKFMLSEHTWPRPILVLDNSHGLVHRGEQLARWHLIEGHQRLTFLRELQRRDMVLAEHKVWRLTAPPTVSVVAVDEPWTQEPWYAHEKLSNAIRYLAVGGGSMQERISNALTHSAIERLNRNDFPPDMRERWDVLLAAQVSELSELSAHHFAREVVEFYSWTCYRLGDAFVDD